jgi:lipoprotein-anchoring transpeptidase ErfK/SrfK
VRWIDVDLTHQQLAAYEGDELVRFTAISSGLSRTPTPAGQYHIWIKLRYDDMTGPGYYLPNVPYVMYFHGGFGLHGTYWHANFGYPMSHGCVNLPMEEAEWLYFWATVGTMVNIHY